MASPDVRIQAQAAALDELLRRKKMKLDGVIELKVNEGALLQRVENRAAETRARGEEVRADDTPEVLARRLAQYRELTEPLIHYYSERRKLLTVDGMMTIEQVTLEINRILAAVAATEAKAAAKKASAKRAKPAKTVSKPAKKPAKSARKAARKAKKAVKKPARKAAKPARGKVGRKGAKAAKKVTKRRAKR